MSYQLRIAPDRPLRTFDAQVRLDVEVVEPTQEIVLDSAGLQIVSARLDEHEQLAFRVEAAAQRLTLSAVRPLERGGHSLLVHYRGEIGEQGPGLFRVVAGSSPQAEYLYTALWGNGQARYLAPIWDQPGAKAVFELELLLTAPLEAVSTMPILTRELAGDGKVRIVFQPTPKMTPRLFFLAAGPFERIARPRDSVDIGVVVPRGLAVNSALVLDTTGAALRYIGDYVARPHPLPKLDSVLLPQAPGGAVANWGAIQYAQRYLTVAAPSATREELQISYAMIAHEVSHQWFGNLVTPLDRRHAWLSEGFAVWLENKIAEQLHPDWPSWLHAVQYREAAMQLEARAATHPIVAEPSGPVASEIVYDKSAQVLRMLESYLGEQVFQAAVREYVAKNAYGTVVSADFWRALASVSTAPVEHIGTDFTEQVGVPLIDVVSTRCAGGSSKVIMRQAQFMPGERAGTPRVWRVPVSAVTLAKRERAHRVVSGTQSHELEVAGCGAVKVNADSIGYFRTRYDARSFAALAAAFTQLTRADQLGLLHDQYALAEAGYASFGDYLDLASKLSHRLDPLVNLQWVHAARALHRVYYRSPDHASFREFARAQFGLLLREVSSEPKQGEPVHMPLLRAALIELLAELDDNRVQQQERTADELHRDEVLRTRLPQVTEWLARRAASSRSRAGKKGKSTCAAESERCN